MAVCCTLCVCAISAPAQAQAPARTAAPEVIERVDAVYPPQALEQRLEGTATLKVTIEADGRVGDIDVVESAGSLLDDAATKAMRQWRFQPATRGGEPTAAIVRVPFRFDLPAVERLDAGAPPPLDAGVAAPDAGGVSESAIDVTVRGERKLRNEDRGSSTFTVAKPVLEAAPRQEGAEVLRTVPGLYIARSEGLAVGHRYMLRGFDADHGQDIQFTVGGLPINQPSHLHGQGYADLGFLISESVEELTALEGVYDPRQGDFAVAGSIDVRLGMEQRGWAAKSSYGAFNSFRQLVSWAPEGQPNGTFGAAQYTRTDGFGQNRQGEAASAIIQAVLGTTGAWRHRLLGILYGARGSHAGVVRQDDVAAGRIGFYDVYPLATAQAQNALSGRIMLGLFSEYRGAEGSNAEAGVWLGLDDFRVQQNFTGFTQRSQALLNVAGRGDLIEQQNRTLSLGLMGRYRTRPYRPASWATANVELGLSGRVDSIDQAQNLLDAVVRRQTWDRRVDASVFGADVGFYGDVEWRLTKYLNVRVGARADVLYYDVNDRLGNFVPSVRPPDTFIVGYRRSALGLAAGPRASVEVKPIEGLSLRAAYGEGYRSPQARILDDGEAAPFSKVRSADLGVRIGRDDRLQITASGYFTHLSDDVAFDAEDGRLERIGQTRRVGAVVHAQTRPLAWLVGALSVTYVHAQLLERPPGSAQDPQPPYQPGQSLPYVPPVVVRADLGAKPTLVPHLWRWDLVGRAGVGFSYLSPRPLPYGAFADHVALADASVGLTWGPLDLGFEVYNLFNTRYAATELNFPSSWNPEGVRTRTPERHLIAGSPLSWWLTLGVSL
ncbi:MAG: TonB-dependent receptor [Myxococcaceae bacterium]|nr:TonB-dependent receptor [Myxococcaceae bacterium]